MFVILDILSFGDQLQKSVFNFSKIIINSDNSLVYGIVNFAAPLISKIWAWWSDILNPPFKAPSPPKFCPHAFSFGATLLCVWYISEKNSYTPCGKNNFD